MAGFVNVGVYVDGARPKTKKALTEALRDNPASVRFDRTALFDEGDNIKGDDIPAEITLTVTGPDPFTARRWYASVRQTPEGPRVVR